MKSHHITAFKVALGLSSGYVFGPLLFNYISGSPITEAAFGKRLIVGICWFVILFIGIWIYGKFARKDLNFGVSLPEKARQQGEFINKKDEEKISLVAKQNSTSIYDQIAQELDTNQLHRGTWVQAYALTNGDEATAKAS